MPDPVTPQIVPPQDSEGNNLGGVWGTPTRPWGAAFFHALFVRGKAVATVDSPRFVGEPKAQTPETSDNTERIANTSWVRTFVGSVSLASSNITGLATGVLAWLQDPTSAKLRTAVTDETGTGSLVFANTPTLVTPVLGAATATSINGVAIDTATSATLDLANSSTLATSGAYSLTLTTTGATNVTLPTTGTLATANSDTILASGTANECTAADLRTHLDDATKHRQINNSGTGSTDLWSASKITSELGTRDTAITAALARSAHTGTQTASTISDFNSSVDARVTTALGTDYLKADGSVAGTGRQEIKLLNLTDWASHTLSSGGNGTNITQSLVTLSSESGITDDWTTLTVTSAGVGDVIYLRAASGHTITAKNGTDNLVCAGAADFTFTAGDVVVALKDTTNWLVGKFSGAPGGGSFLTATGSVAGTGTQELKRLNFTDPTTLTIATGVITATQSLHLVDTESAASTDDLVTINGNGIGDILIISAAHTDRTVVLKHGTGNIVCAAASDVTLDTDNKLALLVRMGTNWIVLAGGTAGGGGGDALTASSLAQFAATTSLELKTLISDETGSGALVFANTPTLVTPVLGVPASGTLTNCSGLPISTGVSGLGTGVATFLATPSSANLAAAVTDESGTGALLFAGGAIGTPSSGTLTNCTGLPTAGIVDAAVTLAKMANVTQGDLITRTSSGSGVPQIVGIGSTGQVLEVVGGVPSWQFPKVEITVAASDETTNLTTGTAKVTFRMPHAMTLTGVRASVGTAQTAGSILTIDVNEAGSSVLSTKLTIDNNEKTSTTAATAAVISDSALADDAEITIDIDTVGTAGAKGLKVTLIGRRA